MIGADALRAMKRGAYLINNSRGTVVDLDALAARAARRASAWCGGRRVPGRAERRRRNLPVAAAGRRERHPDAACRRLDRGGAGAHRRRGRAQADRLWRDRRDPRGGEFSPGPAADRSTGRAICMSTATSPASCAGGRGCSRGASVNIAAQYLQTDGEIGYVVIDADGSRGETARAF